MRRKKLSCIALLLLMFFALGIVAESVALAAPVGEWKFDEGHGILTDDSSGQGKTGRIWGSTFEWVEGIRNKALQFASSADYVQVPGSVSGSLNTLCNWSITAYIKPTGSSGGYVYSEKDHKNNLCLYISITEDDGIKVATNHSLRPGWDTYQTGSNKIKRNEWNHLVVTLENGGVKADSGIVKCYVNGVLAGEGRLGCSGTLFSYSGNAIPYCITKPGSDKFTAWLKTSLQGNETKYFCMRKVPGYTPINPSTMFQFYEDFESGTANSSKWEYIPAESASGGIYTDWKFGLYSLGINHSTGGSSACYLAKIPLSSIPVGTTLHWSSENYGKYIRNTYTYSVYSGLGTNQSCVTALLNASLNAGSPSSKEDICTYDVMIRRVSTNGWEFDIYRDGKYFEKKTLTQSFTNYLLFGLHSTKFGNATTAKVRMDNVIVRTYASIEPTVSVFEFTDYYIVSVKNNLGTALTNYQVPIPVEQLGILNTNTSLEIKQVIKAL